jgi:hypothetical protein
MMTVWWITSLRQNSQHNNCPKIITQPQINKKRLSLIKKTRACTSTMFLSDLQDNTVTWGKTDSPYLPAPQGLPLFTVFGSKLPHMSQIAALHRSTNTTD